MAKATQTQPANRPEKKFGPYPGGIGVAIWVNTIETANGPRKFRSITLSPRRYRDPETGDWRDASSYRPGDLPALLFGLQSAMEYAFTVPIENGEQRDEADDVPF